MLRRTPVRSLFVSSSKIITTIIFLLRLVSAAASGSSPTQYFPVEDFAVNCGSSVNSTALDGREWIGDMASNFASTSRQPTVSSTTVNPLFVDWIPYMTARISRSEFTYRFRVRAGQKFIRLHFHPASYRGFEKSKALFTVRAGPYILLANFSAALTVDALGVKFFVKEYCVNVQNDYQTLSITFSPSQGRTSDDIYAFINGIEIVSMPTGLYYSGAGNLGARVAGKEYRFYIESSAALELVYRLNVGGRSILPLQDLGMYRLWSEDKNYLLASDVIPVSTPNMIKYTDNWKYAGPLRLYQTAWAKASNPQSNQRYNYTWKLPVDLGFRYLVRLHFCDHELQTTEAVRKKFVIFINNQVAESEADVMRWSGGSGIAVYRDYVASMEGHRPEGRRDFIITLQPMYEWRDGQIEAMMMNGIEIFKLSNPDNDLAGPNPISRSRKATSWTSRLQNLVLALGRANAIATGTFVLLTLLNIIVFQLTIWKPHDSQVNITSTSSLPTEDEEQGCRLFSLVEIQLATNNFDDKFVIGRGGFGKVYRGLMDAGTRLVAIKRLNPESKQGAEEFWAEVETLSKFQHTHLVSLLGYYEDRQEMLLVYEYVAGGSLADHIYGASGNDTSGCPLSWEQRLNICIGAARGLNYLHTGRGEQDGVIHRDVKSSNILLGQNLEAKISDFGLAKMFGTRLAGTHLTTKVKGTFGFMDPDYFVTHRLTFKSDVYAFGVVLLEVLCGRPALDRRVGEDKHSLTLWVRQCITEARMDEIVDPSVREQITARCLEVFVDIATRCLRNQPKERPTMGDLVGRLEYALELQGRPDSYSEEQEVVSVEQHGIVDSHVEESEVPVIQENIKTQRVDSLMLHRDRMRQNSQTLEHFNEYKTEETSITPTTSRNDRKAKSEPKRKKNNSSNRAPNWKWWNSIWRRNKPSKIGALEVLPVGQMGLCRLFSFSEIRAATRNFSTDRVIGTGGFGNVYKGYLDDGSSVAIKRSALGSRLALMEFKAEIETLSKMRHRNLVSLLGYCYEGREMILVYDYMSNGNLRDHLYGNNNRPLSWERRLRICIGAARGLQYLHSGAQLKIIHRDVKSTNILLDGNWDAKIADFALSKWDSHGMSYTHITTNVKGTFGYLDPMYFLTLQLTDKSDVYSFGVLLFEVLCARPAVDATLARDEAHLAEWVRRCIRHRTLYQNIDPYLIGKITPLSFKNFVAIAACCIRSSGNSRPPMAYVVERLQSLLQLPEKDIDAEQQYTNVLEEFDDYDIDFTHIETEGGAEATSDRTFSSDGTATWMSG